MNKDRIYKIVFFNQGNGVELSPARSGGAETSEAVYWRRKE